MYEKDFSGFDIIVADQLINAPVAHNPLDTFKPLTEEQLNNTPTPATQPVYEAPVYNESVYEEPAPTMSSSVTEKFDFPKVDGVTEVMPAIPENNVTLNSMKQRNVNYYNNDYKKARKEAKRRERQRKKNNKRKS